MFQIDTDKDADLALTTVRDEFLNDLRLDYIRMDFIRSEYLEENYFRTLSQTHEPCFVITESPSAMPTTNTEKPSIHKPEGSSSLLFIIMLRSNKSASETSICCRNQVLLSGREILKKTINDIASKPTPTRTLYDSKKKISQQTLGSTKDNNTKKYLRTLQQDRDDEGAQLYAVILEKMIDQEGKNKLFICIEITK